MDSIVTAHPELQEEAEESASSALPLVLAQLEEDIALGRLRPRERLVEDDLIQRFKTKRHIVREALIQLERMGVVVRRRNRGATVRDLNPNEVEQIYLVRTLLERQAAQMIPLPAPRLAGELERIHQLHTEAVKAGALVQVFRLNLEFHRVLFAGCGNPYLAEAIEVYAQKTHGIRSYAIARPNLLTRARDEHAAMIAALSEGDREQLVALCTSHLVHSKDAYIQAYRQIFPEA